MSTSILRLPQSQLRIDAAVHCIMHSCEHCMPRLLNNLQAQDKLVALGYRFGPVHYLDWERHPYGHRQWVAKSQWSELVVLYNEYGDTWWLSYQGRD